MDLYQNPKKLAISPLVAAITHNIIIVVGRGAAGSLRR